MFKIPICRNKIADFDKIITNVFLKIQLYNILQKMSCINIHI